MYRLGVLGYVLNHGSVPQPLTIFNGVHGDKMWRFLLLDYGPCGAVPTAYHTGKDMRPNKLAGKELNLSHYN